MNIDRIYSESLGARGGLIVNAYRQLNEGKSVAEVIVGRGDADIAFVLLDAFDRYPQLPPNFASYEDGLTDNGRGKIAEYVADKAALFSDLKKAYESGAFNVPPVVIFSIMEMIMDENNVEALYQGLPSELRAMALYNMMAFAPESDPSVRRQEAKRRFQAMHKDDDWNRPPSEW